MTQLELRVTLTLDDAGPRESIDALRDIADGAANYIGDYYTADNPGSGEAPMRHDGWQGPFVTKIETEFDS